MNFKGSIFHQINLGGKIVKRINLNAKVEPREYFGKVGIKQQILVKGSAHNRPSISASVNGLDVRYPFIFGVEFFKVDNYRLIILGATSVISDEQGVYIDCSPDNKWIDPELRDGILTIKQAYSIRQTDNVLEVK